MFFYVKIKDFAPACYDKMAIEDMHNFVNNSCEGSTSNQADNYDVKSSN